MKSAAPRDHQDGFSILEVVVATVILGLVMGLVLAGTIAFARMYANVAATADLQRQERWFKEHLGRDIRMAKNIDSPSENQLVLTDHDNEAVTYRMVAQTDGTHDLVRIENLETRRIVKGVQDWTFPINPSTDLNLTVTLTISAVDGRGQLVNQQISGSFTRRLALY